MKAKRATNASAAGTQREILKTAREKFGYEQLRPGQEEAIESILGGRDTLVIMPTGSGKSAIYQIAGLLMKGTIVVVSPLIALQRDQVQSIQDREVGDAAVVNSTLSVGKRRETMEQLNSGALKFVFLAPEQFEKSETLDELRNAGVCLFVVDEAHCISEWGHDFRPDYLRLGAVAEELGHPVILALTAAAGPEVRQEIQQRLNMRSPRVIVRGFNRPNIWLGVRTFKKEREKTEALLDEVQDAEKPGIVYVATRKHAEEIAAGLDERGVNCAFYHGGMRPKERSDIQDQFMTGGVEVMVATSAFGMGVDKPNVRFVFHHDISESIDAYYQEIGRAGRDGLPARAVLFYRPEDLSLQRFFAGTGKIQTEQIEEVATAIENTDEAMDLEELKAKTGLSQAKLVKAVNRLEEVGALEIHADGEVSATDETANVQEVTREAAKEQEKLSDLQSLRLEKAALYAELLSCRREYLLNYFGEEIGACGYCDNCETHAHDAGSSPEKVTAMAKTQERSVNRKPAAEKARKRPLVSQQDRPFPEKTRVVHTEWGKGVVKDYDGDKMEVVFDTVGSKRLSVQTVIELNLLSKL